MVALFTIRACDFVDRDSDSSILRTLLHRVGMIFFCTISTSGKTEQVCASGLILHIRQFVQCIVYRVFHILKHGSARTYLLFELFYGIVFRP